MPPPSNLLICCAVCRRLGVSLLPQSERQSREKKGRISPLSAVAEHEVVVDRVHSAPPPARTRGTKRCRPNDRRTAGHVRGEQMDHAGRRRLGIDEWIYAAYGLLLSRCRRVCISERTGRPLATYPDGRLGSSSSG